MKRNLIRSVLIALLLISLPQLFSCDTTKKKHPYVVIHVNYSGTVDSDHRLYMIFYFLPNWSSPYFIITSAEKRIIIPRLNIGTTVLYFEIVHDVNGDGVGPGDVYQGWSGVTDMAALLTPLVLPSTEVVTFNFDLDNNAAIPALP